MSLTDVYSPRINGLSTSIRTFLADFVKFGIRVTLEAPDYPGPDSKTDAAADVVRLTVLTSSAVMSQR